MAVAISSRIASRKKRFHEIETSQLPYSWNRRIAPAVNAASPARRLDGRRPAVRQFGRRGEGVMAAGGGRLLA